ncbi:type II secretion system F family protein [Chitinimonas sp. PSY-7]|uniref:type II secretion system F family protein n=1 Tax=Chitinimonas sp. PSY-7 TaxID=3459088 RepID=UPI0040400F04
MAQSFRVSAIDSARRLVSLNINADSPEQARAQIQAQGLKVVGVTATGAGWSIQRKPKFDLLLFTQELVALLEAGLSLTECIETLAEKEAQPAIRTILDELMLALRQGKPLSEAMTARPTIFPELLVANIRASETTGDMDRALGRFIAYQQQIDALKKRLIGAAIYPAMLLMVGGGVCLFLLGYLVPKFSRIYEGMHTELPFMSQMLLTFGGAIEKNRMAAVLILLGTLSVLGWLSTLPAVRAAMMARAWRSPWLGERLRLFQLARFYRAAGMLQCSGIPVVTAYERVAGLLHPVLRGPLLQVVGALRQGQPLADTMQRAGLTTPVALRLLRVGEKSGKLGEMMERIASFHDDELSRFVDAATKLIEPLLMLLMGGFIGLIVVLMYLPIFDLAGGLK